MQVKENVVLYVIQGKKGDLIKFGAEVINLNGGDYMQAVKGVYENGRIELLNPLPI